MWVNFICMRTESHSTQDNLYPTDIKVPVGPSGEFSSNKFFLSRVREDEKRGKDIIPLLT